MIAAFGQVFRLKIISYDKDFNPLLYHTRYRHQQMSSLLQNQRNRMK